MGVKSGIGLSSKGCTLGIANGQYLRAFFLGIASGHQSVHGLARLRNGNNQSLFIKHRIAIAKLVG